MLVLAIRVDRNFIDNTAGSSLLRDPSLLRRKSRLFKMALNLLGADRLLARFHLACRYHRSRSSSGHFFSQISWLSL